jgi:hypothetical protein
MHPYHKAAHKNDPSWLRWIQKFVEKHGQADVDDVVRNYGSDKKITEDAAYPVYEENK